MTKGTAMKEVNVRFKDRILTDFEYDNAVDQFQARARRRNAIILILVAVLIAATLIWRLMS